MLIYFTNKEKKNNNNTQNNTEKSSKAYLSLLKVFLNNKNIPLIPPLFHENRFMTYFKEKA